MKFIPLREESLCPHCKNRSLVGYIELSGDFEEGFFKGFVEGRFGVLLEGDELIYLHLCEECFKGLKKELKEASKT